MTPVSVVIPVKALDRAKGRLASVLTPKARRELVLDMLVRALVSAAGSRAAALLVVTSDPEARSLALAHGGEVLTDPGEELNACLLAGFERCWRRGNAPLYLPADLPQLEASTVDALLATAREDSVVLAPAHDGGTNALLAPPKAPLEPRLGRLSFERHLEEAKRRGYEVQVYRDQALALDVDTPADLEAARALAPP